MNKLTLFVSVFVTFGFIATANATIIDTADNSFVDQNTGLEWMDFGVNNSKSFDYVGSHLDSDYFGWRLATQAEAVVLWTSLFSEYPGWRAYHTSPTDPLQGYSTGSVSVNADGDIPWLNLIDIMGYNRRLQTNPSIDPDWYNIVATGLFASEIDPDGLGYVVFGGYERCPSNGGCGSSAQAVWSGGIGHTPSVGLEWISTLLVKDAADAPEPSTLALLCLGLAATGYSRKKTA